MPPWVQKVTGRKVSTVQNEDGSWTSRRSYSRGKVHVGWSESTVKWFDKEFPSLTLVIWPDGSVYKEIPHGAYGEPVHQKIQSAVYEMADALRGVDTSSHAMVG